MIFVSLCITNTVFFLRSTEKTEKINSKSPAQGKIQSLQYRGKSRKNVKNLKSPI
eukprot:UN23071